MIGGFYISLLEDFPANSPPRHSGETVALFLHLSHPDLLFPTRSVALFRKKMQPYPRQWRAGVFAEHRPGGRQIRESSSR